MWQTQPRKAFLDVVECQDVAEYQDAVGCPDGAGTLDAVAGAAAYAASDLEVDLRHVAVPSNLG